MQTSGGGKELDDRVARRSLTLCGGWWHDERALARCGARYRDAARRERLDLRLARYAAANARAFGFDGIE